MSPQVVEFDPKNMPFRRLGPSGLRVPVFSIGGWLTIGSHINDDAAFNIVKAAFDNGINFFDVAEGYANGNSEIELGKSIKRLNCRRSDLIISTKIYGGVREGPNAKGLNRKHLIEGTKESLERLQMDYVDIIFAHKNDPTTPMEETVRGFTWIINQGWAHYWGTSEWSVEEIEAAYHAADKFGLIAPIAEQCEHHMFHRQRPEREYAPLYKHYNYGTTVYSPLAKGMLTGKYNDGIPDGSRYAVLDRERWKALLESDEGKSRIEKVKQLTAYAKNNLECSVSHLALAWIVKRSANTGTVIFGATNPQQVVDNLKAIDILPKLTPKVLTEIEKILKNRPPAIRAPERELYYDELEEELSRNA